MYSHKVLLLILVTIVMTGCQTRPVKYEVDTVVRPLSEITPQSKPRQYIVDITVTETSPNGESIVSEGQIQTMVGKEAEMTREEIYTDRLPGMISCTALVKHEEDGNRVDTSVSIVKKGKEVCSIKQSTTLSQ